MGTRATTQVNSDRLGYTPDFIKSDTEEAVFLGNPKALDPGVRRPGLRGRHPLISSTSASAFAASTVPDMSGQPIRSGRGNGTLAHPTADLILAKTIYVQHIRIWVFFVTLMVHHA